MSEPTYRITELRVGGYSIPLKITTLVASNNLTIVSEVTDPESGQRRRQVVWHKNVGEMVDEALATKPTVPSNSKPDGHEPG